MSISHGSEARSRCRSWEGYVDANEKDKLHVISFGRSVQLRRILPPLSENEWASSGRKQSGKKAGQGVKDVNRRNALALLSLTASHRPRPSLFAVVGTVTRRLRSVNDHRLNVMNAWSEITHGIRCSVADTVFDRGNRVGDFDFLDFDQYHKWNGDCMIWTYTLLRSDPIQFQIGFIGEIALTTYRFSRDSIFTGLRDWSIDYTRDLSVSSEIFRTKTKGKRKKIGLWTSLKFHI